MTPKPVRLGDAARRDVRAIAFAYRTEAGEALALRFTQALDRALRHIGEHPASGSPRYAHMLELPGLRVWPIRRFPHLVFYVEREDMVAVWRILHARRDIPKRCSAEMIETVGGHHPAANGFTTVICPATTNPCCMSSDKRVSHPARSPEATIIPS